VSRQRMEQMRKNCESCSKEMIQPRWVSGKIDSHFKERRFCSQKCYGQKNVKANASINTIRKRDWRRLEANVCSKCGSTKMVQRHHVTMEIVKILCQLCHTKEHMKRGDWGRSGKNDRFTAIGGVSIVARKIEDVAGPMGIKL
jgi:hypothetical protein